MPGLETRPVSRGSARISPRTDCLTKLFHSQTSTTTIHLLQLVDMLALRKSDRDRVSKLFSSVRNLRHSSETAACQKMVRSETGPRESLCSGSASSQLPGVELACPNPSDQEETCQDGLFPNPPISQQLHEASSEATRDDIAEPLMPPPLELPTLLLLSLICKCCEREYHYHVDQCTKCYSRYFYTLREYGQILLREQKAALREENKLKGWKLRCCLLLAYFRGGFRVV